MKASYLFKQNIDVLLRKRAQSRHDLASFCRRSDAWLSKILGKDDRNLPMAYLDKIADFFGLHVYQLFQPGISPLTERRKGVPRRRGNERRAGQVGAALTMRAADLPLAAEDVALLLRLKSLSKQARADIERTIADQTVGRKRKPAGGTAAAVPHSSSATTPPTGAHRTG
jgi:hypothetical protein